MKGFWVSWWSMTSTHRQQPERRVHRKFGHRHRSGPSGHRDGHPRAYDERPMAAQLEEKLKIWGDRQRRREWSRKTHRATHIEERGGVDLWFWELLQSRMCLDFYSCSSHTPTLLYFLFSLLGKRGLRKKGRKKKGERKNEKKERTKKEGWLKEEGWQWRLELWWRFISRTFRLWYLVKFSEHGMKICTHKMKP